MKLSIVLLRGMLPLFFLLGACGDPADPGSTTDPGTGGAPQSGEAGADGSKSGAGNPVDPVPAEEPIRIEAAVAAEREQEATAEAQRKILDEVIRATAQQQAEGLGTGRVEVHGAWFYDGFSTLAPNPEAAVEARLVAVDLTVSGHTPYFDLDDIEIVDGTHLISYGSDPHSEPLRLDGSLTGPGDLIGAAPAPSRWLLIYAFPKASPTFHLYYWGKKLTPAPVGFGEARLSLPYPRVE